MARGGSATGGTRATAKLTPVTLPASAEVRLRRLAPGATYHEDLHRLLVPASVRPAGGARRPGAGLPAAGAGAAGGAVRARGGAPARAGPAEAPARAGGEAGRRRRAWRGAVRAAGGQPVASPFVKRLLSVLIVVVIAAGRRRRATAESPAVDVNGPPCRSTPSTARCRPPTRPRAASCYLAPAPAARASSPRGRAGQGTFAMSFADGVVDQAATHLLADQYARSLGITVSSADLAQAKTELPRTSTPRSRACSRTAESEGIGSACATAQGQAVTGAGAARFAARRRSPRTRSRFAAYEQKLLARGADLSPAAIAAYYNANLTNFVSDCLSGMVIDTQADAQKFIDQINAGASFASIAKANSLDPTRPPRAGPWGAPSPRSRDRAEAERHLDHRGAAVRADPGPDLGGLGVLRRDQPADAVPGRRHAAVHQALLFATANTTRVQAELNAYARRSDHRCRSPLRQLEGCRRSSHRPRPGTVPRAVHASPRRRRSCGGSRVCWLGRATGTPDTDAGTSGTTGTTGTTGTPARPGHRHVDGTTGTSGTPAGS